ncbi:hypothetical protein F4778DRAFT_779863 [Xylariomycetidae sp. FL2044]|nr:hypothetical protein F4778DRAFT_779863 [Xylariomycetidae sp. FL2044]
MQFTITIVAALATLATALPPSTSTEGEACPQPGATVCIDTVTHDGDVDPAIWVCNALSVWQYQSFCGAGTTCHYTIEGAWCSPSDE